MSSQIYAAEDTPLLNNIDNTNNDDQLDNINQSHTIPEDQDTATTTNRTLRTRWQLHWSTWSHMYFFALFVILVDSPSFMAEAPKLRMLEQVLCRNHYSTAVHNPDLIGTVLSTYDNNGTVPEHLCKITPVQSSLARMRGYLSMLEFLPSLVLAIPFGILADMRGRKTVVALGLIGCVLKDIWYFTTLFFYDTFSVRAVYGAPAFLLLGGGPGLLAPMIMAMIAATTPEALRARAFFWLHVSVLTAELVSPPIGAFLMSRIGAQYTFLVSIPLESVGALVLILIPAGPSREPEIKDSVDVDDETGVDVDISKTSLRTSFSGAVSWLDQYARRDMMHIVGRKNLVLGIAALSVAKIGRPILDLILQYMSARFGWPLKRTAYLISLQAAAQFPLFILILPYINHKLTTLYESAKGNLVLARGSAAVIVTGGLVMALAPTPSLLITGMIIYVLGNGFGPALRSLLSQLVPAEHLALLFTTITVFEGLAGMAAAPLLGLSFSAGLEIGGLARSLPFFVASAFYAVAGSLLVVMSTKRS